MSEVPSEPTTEPEQEWEHPQEPTGATETPGAGEGDAATPDAEGNPSEGVDEAASTEQPEEGIEDPDMEPSPGTPEYEGESPAEPHAEAESAAPPALSEKDLDRIHTRMEKYRADNAERIARILGGEFEHAAPCPLCSHFSPGYIGLVDVPDEALMTMRLMLGMPDLSAFSPHPTAHTCTTCEGKGETLTGSHVPNFETLGCPDCGGKGYVGATAVPANGQPTAEAEPVMTGPLHVLADDDDPAIAVLKARGFTVIPPMQVPQA